LVRRRTDIVLRRTVAARRRALVANRRTVIVRQRTVVVAGVIWTSRDGAATAGAAAGVRVGLSRTISRKDSGN
jgi:hypothetical protein